MQIPSYQITNVIKVYSRQLSQSRLQSRASDLGWHKEPTVDTVSISPEGKSQTLIEQVSKDVLGKITRYQPKKSTEDTVEETNAKEKKRLESSKKKNTFVFNFIGEDNQKVTHSISVGESQFKTKAF